MLKSITDPERKKRLKTLLSKIDKENQASKISNMHSSVRKKTKTNLEKEWLLHANKEYNSDEEIRQFQNRIKQGDLTHLKHFDDAMTANLKIIVDFLGTVAVWNFIFENKINLYLFKPFPRTLVNSKKIILMPILVVVIGIVVKQMKLNYLILIMNIKFLAQINFVKHIL